MSRASTQQMLRQIPLSWAIGILVLLVSYWLAQPILNSRLGWQLPSLASLLGEPQPKPAEKKAVPRQAPPKIEESQASANSDEADPPARTNTAKTASSKKAASQPKESPAKAAADKVATKSDTKESTDLLYGLLKETGRERYVSPEGVQYNPGSEEGHRLRHLERHLKDQPDRPGKHGVFDGDMPQVLKWIDDAYARGKRGAKGVRKQEEDGRTVYEVPFTQPIGFIGGRDGGRDGHPAAKRLRLVVDGNRFITAFPF